MAFLFLIVLHQYVWRISHDFPTKFMNVFQFVHSNFYVCCKQLVPRKYEAPVYKHFYWMYTALVDIIKYEVNKFVYSIHVDSIWNKLGFI